LPVWLDRHVPRDFTIETLGDPEDSDVRKLLIDFTSREQDHYDHPRQSRDQIDATMPPIRRRFTGENHLFVARDPAGVALGRLSPSVQTRCAHHPHVNSPSSGRVSRWARRPSTDVAACACRGPAPRRRRAVVLVVAAGQDELLDGVCSRQAASASSAARPRASADVPERAIALRSAPMALSADDVRHVARLARLGLDDGEFARFGAQLDAILHHVSRLQSVDTSTVEETAQVTGLVNVWRDDTPHDSFPAEVALANAPVRQGPYFQVGAIQE